MEQDTTSAVSSDSLGYRLAEARKAKGWTQGDLAEGLSVEGTDMSKAAVSAWERNTRQPSAQQLGILCQRLGVTADYLLFGRVVRRMPNQIEAA